MDQSDQLVFLPLGGVGEIGMNLALYGVGPETDRSWIVVDYGLGFAKESLPGVDQIFPDIEFLEREKDRVQGIILTHAHEDHYGALLDLWPRIGAPVFATPFTSAMIEAKLSGAPWAEDIDVREVQQGDRWQLEGFDLELVPVSHSIPEPNALVIRTTHGTVIHTGDWKVDATPVVGKPLAVERLREIGDEGVLALVCDSTNAIRDGISPSESEVGEALFEFIASAPGRVAVTSFASNVARMRTVVQAAERAERNVILAGRSMQRIAQISNEMGYFDGLPPFVSEDEFGYIPRDKVLVLCTGSQGEDRAALARISEGSHRSIKFSPGDRVIFSSRTIPGNEIPVNDVVNRLCDQGIDVITDRDGLIHVSGHPRRGELEQMYEWVKPQIAVPVHGEALHLAAHAKFARERGIDQVVEARNGLLCRLAPGEPGVAASVPAGRLYKDGKLVCRPEESGVGERRKLSFAGVVSISLVLSRKGEVLDDPVADLFGLPDADESGGDFEELVLDIVDSVVDNIPQKRKRDARQLEESIRRAVRNEIQQVWGKKPSCFVRVHVV